ncbi:MAG TPA: hypothetical protein VLG36_04540 [Candidatus Chromulinivoraceae bacterium]|nr:hypothetical protein [Candidatus Chromulinivoraceae bacterium]
MTDQASTKLTIREDRPTALSSAIYGANLNAVGFNIALIALRDPKLATAIVKLYAKAHKIQESDRQAPDEDLELFMDEFTIILSNTSDDTINE